MPQLLTAKALREQRHTVAASIRQQADKINAEARDFTPEEKAAWDAANADYEALSSRIAVAERADALDATAAAPAGRGVPPFGGGGSGEGAGLAHAEELRALAIQGWIASRGDGRPITDRQREACAALNVNPNSRELTVQLWATEDYKRFQRRYRDAHPSRAADHCQDFRANSLSGLAVGSGGALLAPETLVRNLEVNMLAFGGMRQVAETIMTDTGEPMSWPTADDTTNEGEQLGDEPTNVDNSGAGGAGPTFDQTKWFAHTFSSKAIIVPSFLLRNSVLDLVGTLGEMMGTRIGRTTNKKYTYGAAAGTARGILTCAALGVTTASPTKVAADELIDLEHSIDPAYRQGAGYMFHDSTLLAFRKLKDGQGRYLWQEGYNTGAPDTINRRPYTINQDMPTIATGNKSVLFGQLSKYKIRRVRQARFYRLEELYRAKDCDGFISFVDEDGNLLDAGTRPVKYLLQA